MPYSTNYKIVRTLIVFLILQTKKITYFLIRIISQTTCTETLLILKEEFNSKWISLKIQIKESTIKMRKYIAKKIIIYLKIKIIFRETINFNTSNINRIFFHKENHTCTKYMKNKIISLINKLIKYNHNIKRNQDILMMMTMNKNIK